MYCESCGNFVPDGQSFCSSCGASVAQSAPAAQPAAAQPVATQPVAAPAAQPVYQQPVYQQPAYQQPVYQQPVYQQPVYQQGYQQAYQPGPTVIVQQPPIIAKPAPTGNGPATAGLVFGILTMVFCWTSYFCSIFGLLGLIFSIIGIAKKKAPGKGKAIAGLVLTITGSVLVIVINELFWAAAGVMWDSFLSEVEEDLQEEMYDTSYSNNVSDDYYINGDFVTTEKGYVSGVLHIDGFRVDF